jgi:hypothetical protein
MSLVSALYIARKENQMQKKSLVGRLLKVSDNSGIFYEI